MKEQFRAYFSFSRKERIGILILLLLVLVVGVVPSVLPDSPIDNDSKAIIDFRQQLAMVELNPDSAQGYNSTSKWPGSDIDRKNPAATSTFRTDTRNNGYSATVPVISRDLFYFDPNTLSPADWGRLGVKSRTVATIQNYLSKGGSFRKPEDLLRIYGLSEKDKEALLPFVRIKQEKVSGQKAVEAEVPMRNYPTGYSPKLPPVKLDINLADSTAWQRLPGIGKSLSGRIVRFRERLGGFTNTEQVKDVYGIHDTVFQKIEKWLFFQSPPRKIQLNLVAVDDLAAHPYCGMRLAKTIIDFRTLHGPFKQTSDLKQLASLSGEQYNRLIPYLEIN
ncbi:MAG: hypothetical protein EOO02_06990 [Chitinophagaceae bacterium]|nr:MAG: hypothetical protein EOO02_06990 [Chitinophagaceae bacterium]